MAECSTVSTEKIVCPFYLYSLCQDGVKCKYSHAAIDSKHKNEIACYFFFKGDCKFGDKCWFLHSIKEDINSNYIARETKKDEMTAGPSHQFAENVNPSTAGLDLTNSAHNKCNFRCNNSFIKRKKSCGPNSPNWVDAPEFIPSINKSYSDALKSTGCVNNPKPQMELCLNFIDGKCPYSDQCKLIHGDLCKLCNKHSLNPFDALQRKLHIERCEKELEKNMELSSAIQRSVGKTCGICRDIIMEKELIAERLFGILQNCNHVYCLSCIRKWRSVEVGDHVEQFFDPVVTRACPECRVPSDFITPSQYWVETEEEKTKLIADYKLALSKKPCKYFKQGQGTCHFGGSCFYLHAMPDGTKVVLPPPYRRRRLNDDEEDAIIDSILNSRVWDNLVVRNGRIIATFNQEEFSFELF